MIGIRKNKTVEELKREVGTLELLKALCESRIGSDVELEQMERVYQRKLKRVKAQLERVEA